MASIDYAQADAARLSVGGHLEHRERVHLPVARVRVPAAAATGATVAARPGNTGVHGPEHCDIQARRWTTAAAMRAERAKLVVHEDFGATPRIKTYFELVDAVWRRAADREVASQSAASQVFLERALERTGPA